MSNAVQFFFWTVCVAVSTMTLVTYGITCDPLSSLALSSVEKVCLAMVSGSLLFLSGDSLIRLLRNQRLTSRCFLA